MVCSLGSCCCSRRRRRASISVSPGLAHCPTPSSRSSSSRSFWDDEALAGCNRLAAGGELVAGAEKELLGVAQLGEACLDLREPLGVRLGRRCGHGRRDADHGFRTGRVELELARPRGELGLRRGDCPLALCDRLLATLCVDAGPGVVRGTALPGGRLFVSASA